MRVRYGQAIHLAAGDTEASVISGEGRPVYLLGLYLNRVWGHVPSQLSKRRQVSQVYVPVELFRK